MALKILENVSVKKMAAVCLAAFAVVILIHSMFGMNKITTDDAYIEGRIHSVASRIPGTVTNVLVDDNQTVKAGECLLELDETDYQLRVDQANAMADIQQAAFTQAERDKQRAEALYKDAVFSKEKYEKVLTAYDLSLAQLNAAKATLDIARQDLEYTKITSPSDGYITKKSVESGNQVQSGQPLLAVVALDDIWLIANFKETQLSNVKPGQSVSIRVDTYPGKKFTGKVDSIMAGTGSAFSLFPPENALGNYVKVVQRIPVKIVFDKNTDQKHTLRVGMSCVPTISTKK